MNLLRLAALTCRAAARSEPWEACRTFGSDPLLSRSAFAEALLPAAAQALGRNVRMFSPGVAQISPDEAWLLRLIISLRHADQASAEFLLRSRVPRHLRRTMRFLATGMGAGAHRTAKQG